MTSRALWVVGGVGVVLVGLLWAVIPVIGQETEGVQSLGSWPGLDEGIVKLSRIGLTDPQHAPFTTGLEPIILGAVSRIFFNLTVSMIPLPVGVAS